MKRATLPKRRQRRSQLSPYHRYGKAPFQYSASYYSWKRQFVKEQKKEQKSHEHQ